jgi:hypothetical protein
MKFIDLTGRKFGRLTVLNRAENRGKRVAWNCLCVCGNNKIVLSTNLIDGKTASCGCFHAEVASKTNKTHGLSQSRLANIWVNMRQRCYNVKNPKYPIYGGRGISVCNTWRTSFISFYQWSMKNGYMPDLTIDRIDPDRNYCPENCRWITIQEQAGNRRNTKNRDSGIGIVVNSIESLEQQLKEAEVI